MEPSLRRPTLNTTGTVIHLTPGAALTASTQYCFYLYNLQGSERCGGGESVLLLHDGHRFADRLRRLWRW